LYKYEADFAWMHRELDDNRGANHWDAVSGHRKHVVSKVMWNKRKGYFFDYNYVKGSQSDTWSLAGYYAMWSGLATEGQAKQMQKNITKFEQAGGLATTTRPLVDSSIFGSLRTQWAYPNGWAPLHLFVVEGFEKYGFETDASRIARKWIHVNLQWFERHGVFQEKYNVVKPKKSPVEGVYPSQTGFGWTNAVFLKLSHKYLVNNDKTQK
jgi:alpha,alpha-trehalase